jgi:hypothetical protein
VRSSARHTVDNRVREACEGGGSTTLTNTTGTAGTESSPEVEANTVYGNLALAATPPAVSKDGHPNTVYGFRSGQCGGAGS